MPEEVHRARLAAEPTREFLQRPVDPAERLPEALHRLAIVRSVLGVLGEGRGHRKPERLGLGLHVDPKAGEQREEALVEGRNREAVRKREGVHLPAARAHDELVGNEVEGDVEVVALGAEAARRQPSCVDVKRGVPPVVLRWRRGQAHLADDLRPEVKRLFRRLPRLERKLRQLAHAPPCEVDSERDLVLVTPAPVLPRLERADDRVLQRPGVRRGMAVRRGVTAADVTAGETEAQMDPPAADAQAVLATRDVLGEGGHLNCVEMRADVRHSFSSPAGASARRSLPARRNRGRGARRRRSSACPWLRLPGRSRGQPRPGRDGPALHASRRNRSTSSPTSTA